LKDEAEGKAKGMNQPHSHSWFGMYRIG